MTSPGFLSFGFTHGLALLIGLGGYALMSNHAVPPTRESATTSTSDGSRLRSRSSSDGQLSLNVAFRLTWERLASCPMAEGERHCMRKKLLEEWVDRDSQGLLAFLERKRVWPDDLSTSSIFGSIAKDRPDSLLDFAIQNGCSDALYGLKYADPETVVGLIEALPPGERGEDIMDLAAECYQKLGKAGIAVAKPTAAYIEGRSEALLEEGRLTEFSEAFAKIDDDGLRDKAADRLGDALSYGKLDEEALEALSTLPAEFQRTAVSRMFNSWSEAMKYREAREERRQAIATMMECGVALGAEVAVRELFSDDDRDEVNGETLEWLKRFPPDDSWKGIESALITEWSDFDSTAMVDGISAMTADAERERLAVNAAKIMRQHGLSDDQRANLARLMSLISDPEVLKQFEEEDSAPSDPFADPFAE